MDYYKTTAKAAIALVLISTLFLLFRSPNDPQPTIIDASKTLFSLPTATRPLLVSTYWIKFKNLLFFNQDPPSVDFRDRDDGAGVKEAIVKSIDKSKVAMEDSAKLAGDAMGDTLHNIKSTFSHHTIAQTDSEEEDEL